MERIDELGCNGYKIIQNTEYFCFGIDSVLLSDFAKNIKKNSRVLDLGTGNGIIATLLCGKTNLKEIIGVEVQKEICKLARRNIKLNNLEKRFSVLEANIKDLDNILEKDSFDVIVTNPPYKKDNTGIKNESTEKLIARHEILCNLEDIIKITKNLLKDKGEFYMVHRTERLVDIIYLLRCYKIEPKIIRFIQPKNSTSANLVLIKAVKNGGNFLKIKPNLIIYNNDGSYTNEIIEIYGGRI